MLNSLVILVKPDPQGQSFTTYLAKLHQPKEDAELFEMTILAKHELQGDMVHERLEDVLGSHLRKLSNDLESKLKQLRHKPK